MRALLFLRSESFRIWCISIFSVAPHEKQAASNVFKDRNERRSDTPRYINGLTVYFLICLNL